jgi:hypothetical protein
MFKISRRRNCGTDESRKHKLEEQGCKIVQLSVQGVVNDMLTSRSKLLTRKGNAVSVRKRSDVV